VFAQKPSRFPAGLFGRNPFLFSANRNVNTTPNAARGEVTVVIAGQQYQMRFSLAVLHDYTRATGHGITDIGEQLNADLLGTIGELLAAAVRRFVPTGVRPADFDAGHALDLIEEMGKTEADAVAEAIWAAVKVDENPFLAALIAKAPKPASALNDNGGSNLTLPTAS
jgi:hypothetical protein